MVEQVYRYKAFISYRHVDPDRGWAKWLIEQLETFRTPKALLAHGVPSHIGHLFRDDDEIPASSNLSGQIEEALKASQFLIVVCSPNTPKSMWCRHEIDYFRKLGKGDRILALLIEGEPSESFPPELLHVPYEVTHPDGSKTIEMREEEPIASDVRPRPDESKHITERRALIRIAATLLGCSFDDLAQRDHQRAVHRQRLIGSAIAAAVLLVVGIGGWYWDHTRIKTAYYADIGSRFAEPFGIAEIGRSDATHRYVSYQIQSQGGRVIRVRRINGLGWPRPLRADEIDSDPWNGRIAEWRIHYQGDRVGTAEVFGATGRLLRTETYRFFADGQSGLVAFTQVSGIAAPLSSNPTAFQTRHSADMFSHRPDVTQHRLAFTPEGLIAKRTFETVWGAPAQDDNGTGGRAYTYTPDGQIASVRVLGTRGQFLVGMGGAAEERRTYTAAGNLARFEYREAHGSLLSAIDFRYDESGNPIDKAWSGPDGKPVANAEDQIAEERDAYDQQGNLIRVRYFDELHQPSPCKLGYAQYVNDYDSLGRVTRTSYFSTHGTPTLSQKSVASAVSVMDAAGNVVGVHLFGLDGKPVVGADGYAANMAHYNDAGLIAEERYYGPDGKLMLRPDGLAILQWLYDSRGNSTEQRWFDTRGKPVLSEGYARSTFAFDDRGNDIAEDYYGLDGKHAINTRNGVAGSRRAYTEHGYLAQIDYIGVNGQPFGGTSGEARLTFAYDDRGNPLEETFFGVNGERVSDPLGFSRMVQAFDADDLAVEQRFFDIADKPVSNLFGYAIRRMRYDARGNDIEETFLGIDGSPVDTRAGYARMTQRFDTNRRVVETRLFTAQGKPVMSGDGFFAKTFAYDRRGNDIGEAMYDTNMKLVVGQSGYARLHAAFDTRSQLTETSYYDANDHLMIGPTGFAQRRAAYDDFGNIVDLAFYKADGTPLMVANKPYSFARMHLDFLPDGAKVERAIYFDDKGRATTQWFVPRRNK